MGFNSAFKGLKW